jgi:hypothetical protein
VIALIIIPLKWADPDSRKVLVPDTSRLSERFTGEDGEGFHCASIAIEEWSKSAPLWFGRSKLATLILPNDMVLWHVVEEHSGLYGVYIEHFSAPSDYDNHFVETPLIAVPVHPSPQQTLRGAD